MTTRPILTRLLPAFALALAFLAPTSAQAAPILQGGTPNTSVANNPNFMVGYDFVPTANLSLTALGFWDSNSNGFPLDSNQQPLSFQVGLWNSSTQTLLASTTISNASTLDTGLTVNGGQWRYNNISPVALTSGTTYTLAFQVGAFGLPAGDTLMLQYPPTVNSNVTVPNTVRFLNTASFTFPTGALPSDSETRLSFRGEVNAQVALADPGPGPGTTPTPEPATLAVFGMMSAAGFGYVRRRLKTLPVA